MNDRAEKAALATGERAMQKTGRWTPGQSGNPAGRPVGARQRISEQLLSDLAEDWEERGKDVLTRLASPIRPSWRRSHVACCLGRATFFCFRHDAV
jgi:hypothetical protein